MTSKKYICTLSLHGLSVYYVQTHLVVIQLKELRKVYKNFKGNISYNNSSELDLTQHVWSDFDLHCTSGCSNYDTTM